MNNAVIGFLFGSTFGFILGFVWSYNVVTNKAAQLIVDTKRIYRNGQTDISTQIDGQP